MTPRFALCALGVLCSCHGADSAPPSDAPVIVRCEGPTPSAVDETVAMRGRLEPPPGGDLPVASQVAGRIAQVMAREGDSIRAGDVVAQLDDANTRDSLREAQAGVAQAQASADNAAATLVRTQALVARGIAPKQELEDAAARAAEAKANLGVARAAADLARRALGRVAVRSSFAGVVTRIWRGVGSLVDGTAATPIAELTATGALDFVAETTAADLARIHEGEPATGSLEDGTTFGGTVRVRGRALDPATGLGTVRVAVPPLSSAAPLGTFGRVVITLQHREGVPTLPAAALRGAILDGAEVAVCAHDKIAIRMLKVGWRGDDRFEVTAGLAPGERVAVDHVLGLEDGTPIAESH